MTADDTCPDGTVARFFAAACRVRADAELFTDAGRRLTGREVFAQTAAFAAALRRAGIAKGDTVAVLAGSSVREALAFFGCQLLGAVVCCPHVRDTPGRLRDTLDIVDASAVVTDTANRDLAADVSGGRPVLALGDDALFAGKAELDAAAVAPDDPAAILLSSGTTGTPKCVLHSQRTLTATAAAGRCIYDLRAPDDSTVVAMAPSFAAWIHTVLPFVHHAGRLHFESGFEPARFLRTLQDERITVAPLVPTAWRMVLGAEPGAYDLSHVRCAFYSGEPGSAALVDGLARDICPGVRTAWLASEGGNAAGIVAGPDILSARPAAAGGPVPGAEVRIVAPEGGIDDVLPPGETGEVAVRGASLAAGYLGQPDLTAARFAGGWWRSGDLGRIDGDGVVFVSGRLDNRINTGGIKVSAEEIEAALLRHPSVRQAAVVGEPDAQWGERIEAHLVLDGRDIETDEIAAHLARSGYLPRHLLPKAIHVHDALPTGPTGKLFRRALRRGETGR